MKNSIMLYKFLGLSALIAAIAIACNPYQKWNSLEFYSVEKSDAYSLPVSQDTDKDFSALHETNMREMDVKVDMQFVKSANIANDIICQHINSQILDLLLKQPSSTSIEEAIENFIADEKKDFASDPMTMTYYDHITSYGEYGMNGIINYWHTQEVFTGGAHPSTTTTILRFATETGQFVSFDQVFPLTSNKRLKEVLLGKLMQLNNVSTLDELNALGYLEMMDMFASKNFSLEADSVIFYYNEYDIAPYAFGPCQLAISYDELQDIINPAFVN